MEAPPYLDNIRAADVVWHATDPMWDVVEPNRSPLDLSSWSGIVENSPADHVVTVRSGTRLGDLQVALAETRQWLPHGGSPFDHPETTLAQAIGFAMPHRLEGKFGSWRDWILGMTVLLGDGVLAKSGSKVVKSVAGYDAHKFFVGARGTFGVIVDVTLRTWPLPDEPVTTEPRSTEGERPWVQRTLATDFGRAIDSAGDALIAMDEPTSTLWARTDRGLGRFPHDWAVRGCPGEVELDSGELPILRRAKELLDPPGKFNPGALGAF